MSTSATGEQVVASPIRARKSAVVDAWIAEVRRDVPEAGRLRASELVGPVDVIVDRLADWLDGSTERTVSLCSAVEAHVADRFRLGFEIDSVVMEYSRLRQCLCLELATREQVAQLDLAIDGALGYAMRRFAAHREELRERYIGVLAHDLRSPLACITMAAEMMLGAERTPRERSLVELVLDSSDRMQRMVTDVLSWARGSGEAFPVVLRPADFGSILRGVIDEARVAYGDGSVVCGMVGDLHGEFDRDRVHQAITNLVRNAIEHGGGAAEVHAAEIDEGATISLVVRNCGPLRSPSSSGVTDPFRRRKRPTNARGLGLYIVDRIARAHAATVEMSSGGDDTVITMRWPTRRTQRGQPATAPSLPAAGPDPLGG